MGLRGLAVLGKVVEVLEDLGLEAAELESDVAPNEGADAACQDSRLTFAVELKLRLRAAERRIPSPVALLSELYLKQWVCRCGMTTQHGFDIRTACHFSRPSIQ